MNVKVALKQKVKWSLKALGYILWEPWISVKDFIAINFNNSCWNISVWTKEVDRLTDRLTSIINQIPLEQIWYCAVICTDIKIRSYSYHYSFPYCPVPGCSSLCGCSFLPWLRAQTSPATFLSIPDLQKLFNLSRPSPFLFSFLQNPPALLFQECKSSIYYID